MAVTVSGIDDVIQLLTDVADMSKLEKAVGKACALVEREAKKKAPKKTGDLRRSIQSKVIAGVANIEGTVFSPLEYAPYVEYGTGLFAEENGRSDVPWCYEDEKTGELIFTSGQKPHPYLRPALNENREKIKQIIMKEGLAK